MASPSPSLSPEASSASKRKRSRAGCYTCRRRKKACDSARPVCGSCTRLGIPCVFPKLYRNAKGELVPSPQPNGRTKKLPRADDSPEIATGMLHSEAPGPSTSGTTTTSNPWETTPTSNPPNWPQSHPSATSTAYPLDDMEGDREGDLSDSALDQFLASLGDTGENGQAWVWPLFTDSSALELDLAGGASGGGGGNGSGGTAGSGPSAAPPSNNNSAAAGYDTGGAANLFLPNKMVTAAAVLEHLPALYDYWVNSFSHVLSVLGPGHNPQVNGMLPVVQRSPLVMCALIAWAATHRANIGHPYEDVARLATDTTELQIDQLEIERDFSDEEREEYMWTLLILGGLEIVRGDVKGWVARLPVTRRLLSRAIEKVDFKKSLTWQSLGYNCVYHDVLASLTTTRAPQFPVDMYTRILTASDLEMDSYMGATRGIFPFLIETAVLAGHIHDVLQQQPSDDRDAMLAQLLAKADSITVRIRAADVPPGLFAHPLPIGTDRSLLVVAFQTYQIAAELYVRQAVLRTGPSDLVNRQLATRILKYMRLHLGTPNESQMMFPLFLAGVCTSNESGRNEVLGIFNKFSQRVQVRNVFTVVNLLIDVWKHDPNGDRFVDWRKLGEEMGVALSFA